MTNPPNQALQFLSLAKNALRVNQRSEARLYAQKAVELDPNLDEGWLILAAFASPHASLVYLSRALSINPKNLTARKGLHWAIQRSRQVQSPSSKADLSNQRLRMPIGFHWLRRTQAGE